MISPRMIREPRHMTLHQAAKDDHLPLDTLVDFRDHVEVVDAARYTALFCAVEYVHRDITDLLLKKEQM